MPLQDAVHAKPHLDVLLLRVDVDVGRLPDDGRVHQFVAESDRPFAVGLARRPASAGRGFAAPAPGSPRPRRRIRGSERRAARRARPPGTKRQADASLHRLQGRTILGVEAGHVDLSIHRRKRQHLPPQRKGRGSSWPRPDRCAPRPCRAVLSLARGGRSSHDRPFVEGMAETG